MEFKDLSFRAIVDLIKTQEVTQREVWEYFHQRIVDLDKQIEAFNYVHKDFEEASVDSIFAGAPIGVKDLFNET